MDEIAAKCKREDPEPLRDLLSPANFRLMRARESTGRFQDFNSTLPCALREGCADLRGEE